MSSLRFPALCALLALAASCSNTSPVVDATTCVKDSDCKAGESCKNSECKACPTCGADEVCIAATCLPVACGDFKCPAGTGCADGRCVTSDCVGVSCGAGEACAQGSCRPTTCPNNPCRAGEFCVDGVCESAACIGVVCPAGQVCANGGCVSQTCTGGDCAGGFACVNGACQDTRCVGVACPSGTLCSGGYCYPPDCNGVSCPSGQACIGGVCTDLSCAGASCPPGARCEAGQCKPCPGGVCCTGPESCGVNGACQKSCVDGTLGACQPASGPVDVQTDVANCGECGNACPAPLNATAKCTAGSCGRTPCQPGFFDLDGPATPGCEATCDGGTCTKPDGGTTIIHSTIIPETGLKQGMADGTSIGGLLQTNPQFTNQAVLGEGVPLPGTGGPLQTNSQFSNQGGFVPVLGR